MPANLRTRSLHFSTNWSDAVTFDVAFGFEAEFFFDFDFDPEALAIEPVLIAELVPGHRLVALKEIFIGASPGVMHAHGIVGGDRAVEKRPCWFALIFLDKFLKALLALPEFEYLALHLRKVDISHPVAP